MSRADAVSRVVLPYGSGEVTASVPAQNLYSILSPAPVEASEDPAGVVMRALQAPIGAPPLAVSARDAERVIILADDMTRQTPVRIIVPALLDELNAGGVHDEQVMVMIALGTHRPMTGEEIADRFGSAVTDRVEVVNHAWQDPGQLADLGDTSNGTPVRMNRAVIGADLVIGVGSVVPHHIAGFSGGAKIVQPGVSGVSTTGATHFLSTRTRRSYLGILDNPVRAEMEEIAERVGLKAVLNVVLDQSGRTARAVYGDVRTAFRAGAESARRVYGVPCSGLADIVVAGSHPCDIEFWQAHKALYPADLVVREGGTIIVVTPCPEGVSVTHQNLLDFAALTSDEIEERIDSGTITDVAGGALTLAWAKIRERASVSLVSDGISTEETRALGFAPHADLDAALAEALHKHGPQARVTVLTHAGDTLPIRGGTT